MGRDDALWYKILSPPARPFGRLWREVLDVQCRAYSLRLRAGFWGSLVVIVIAAIGIATQTEPALSVAISIIGAFLVERCWEWWRGEARRNLASGISMHVRYKPYGPDELRYGTLVLRPKDAIILDTGKPWSSTELCLRKDRRVLATCAFANGIKGDLRHTSRAVADTIRHRISDGSRRMIYVPSPKYDPESDDLPDITIAPLGHSFSLDYADHNESNRRFSIRLRLHQARILTDVLEVMDDYRRL